MTELLIIRHGEYTSNYDSPPFDEGLTPNGIAQVERLRDRLAADTTLKPAVLFSSPLPRADQTAAILAPALNLPVITEPDLEEWNNYDGSPESRDFFARIKEIPYNNLQNVVPFPGALTYAQFAVRVCQRLHRIVEEHAGKTIVIVAHGGIVECSFMYAYGLSPLAPAPVMLNLDPYYTSITRWENKQDSRNLPWRLVTYNDYSHLLDKG